MIDMQEVEPTYEDVNQFADAYFDEVPRVAQQVYRERGVSEPDDIAQAIWESVVQNFDAGYAGMERDEVLRRFRVVGRQYANQESLDNMYFQGNYIYSPEDVRAILEDLQLPGEDVYDQVDGALDVYRALQNLTPARQKAVHKRYADGVQPKDMSKSERNALYRGVDALTHYLNRGAGAKAKRLDQMTDEELEALA